MEACIPRAKIREFALGQARLIMDHLEQHEEPDFGFIAHHAMSILHASDWEPQVSPLGDESGSVS